MGTVATKVCLRCHDCHPIEFFNRDRARPDGLYPYCKTCSRAACKRVYRKYHDRHVAMKREWKSENREFNREINREYRKANPDKVRAGTAAYRARLARATPPWCDLELIEFIRSERPEGHHVDHIHPLAGKNFCGLNVPWNLQYLPAEVHWKKGTQLPVDAEGQVQRVIR